MNNLVSIIYIFSFIWLFPPIRQFKSKYFIYFLTLPLAEAASLIVSYFFSFNQMLIYNFFSLLALVSVLEKKMIKKMWPVIFLVIVYASGFVLNGFKNEIIFIFIHILILAVFMKQFILRIFYEDIFSVFMVLLIFYEFTLITKFINILTGFANASYYYIITSIFEFFIGVFFCIYRDSSAKILIKLDRASS